MQHFTVLFESGLVAGPYCWGWVASRLDKEKFYPIVHDRSSKTFFDACMRERHYSDVLNRLLSSNGPIDRNGSPVIVVGHSIGGLLARSHAHYLGNRLAGIVLVDPSPPEQFAAGIDSNFRYLRLKQILLRRIFRAFIGRGCKDEELESIKQLPLDYYREGRDRMAQTKFWIDAYCETIAAAKFWKETGFTPRSTSTLTAIVSSETAAVPESLQAMHISDLIKVSESCCQFDDFNATHESIVFDEHDSMIVNRAISWVASQY